MSGIYGSASMRSRELTAPPKDDDAADGQHPNPIDERPIQSVGHPRDCDGSGARHAGSATTDPAVLRVTLMLVKDGAGEGYWWVECGTCEHGWQVPHYAVA